jgi:AcrR family transcriptional regulator
MTAHPKQTDEVRPPLSRGRVLEAAIALADARGIGALSMRRLAQELRVEAMSLYHHVANKDEILDGMVDAVLAEVELPAPGTDWKAAIRGVAIATHDALGRHPWAASLMLSRDIPSRLRYMEAVLGSLRRGGFSAEMTDHAYHAIDSHIAGYTMWAANFDIEPETLPALASAFLETLPAAEFPYVVEHVHEHLRERGAESEGEFAFGLDLILDGLERMRDVS